MYRAYPIHVPQALLAAFRKLGVDPILVGGAVVEVWTGRRDGVFHTADLDFIGPDFLTAYQVQKVNPDGIEAISGRHVWVESVPIEFPMGPLGIGSALLDPATATVEVKTLAGDTIRCFRPEACVLDRLTAVAYEYGHFEQYIQALAVASAQCGEPDWSHDWIEATAREARLSRLWAYVADEIASGETRQERLDEAMRIGWDPLGL
ncbi:hypothetical protein [Holophaga foetida]|uniref:hypothetical protein n=1 Tax=Holophaga foetida TaxID=35839 RepID=UPI0002471C41|nr:hypothetical protein [Holophaga foetida]